MSGNAVIAMLEEAEERYLNNCNTPQARARELVYRDVIVAFVAAWLDSRDMRNGEWIEEMGA